MNFDQLDAQMRAFEAAGDDAAPRDGFLVARLDGRGFTRLTKELLTLEKPFDPRFHDAMSAAVAHLFGCGFTLSFAYSQSDEISLLFAPDGVPFERKTPKSSRFWRAKRARNFHWRSECAALSIAVCRRFLTPIWCAIISCGGS